MYDKKLSNDPKKERGKGKEERVKRVKRVKRV
jgi:hypothetical protein